MREIEEVAKNIRAHLVFMLNFWSSKELQYNAQFDTIEFFELWFDLYHPSNEAFILAFNALEKPYIIRFGEELDRVYIAYNDSPPIVEKLVETKEWKYLNKLAINALAKINNCAT